MSGYISWPNQMLRSRKHVPTSVSYPPKEISVPTKMQILLVNGCTCLIRRHATMPVYGNFSRIAGRKIGSKG